MFETLDGIRKRADKQEADLLRLTQEAAALIQPPFTPRQRLRITDGFAKAHAMQQMLHITWREQLFMPAMLSLPFNHVDRVYFNGLSRRLSLWRDGYRILSQVVRRRLPLTERPPADASLVAGQLQAYEQAFYRLHDYLSPPRPDPDNWIGRHNDIPLPFTKSFRLMQLARRAALASGRKAPLAFLDVGCGVGLKVFQAAEFFEISRGLEYDATRVPVADGLTQHARRTQDGVFQADALEFDGYGGYDVIYAYKPLAFEHLLIQMEQRIIDQARPGTVLIMPYSEFVDRFEGYGCVRIEDFVYVTGRSQQDLKPLLRLIGDIGKRVPADPALRTFSEGFAKPLRDALRVWGHLE